MIKMKTELPIVLATKTQNYFTETFKKQGWEGKQWEIPQRRIPGTLAYKYSKYRRKPTLVNTGRLRGAVNTSLRTRNFYMIRMVVDLPYAQRHNEGLKGMPARPFMKDSPTLRRMQQAEITKYLNKLWPK